MYGRCHVYPLGGFWQLIPHPVVQLLLLFVQVYVDLYLLYLPDKDPLGSKHRNVC